MTQTETGVVAIAQKLQTKREAWKAVLDALPCVKAKVDEFPYASMEAACKNDFAKLFGGKDEAFKLLVNGFRTAAWRKAAAKNRVTRDAAAEGEVSVPLVKRVRKTAKLVAEAAKAEAVS